MSKPVPVPDLEAEQEVDLRRWRGALAERWWLPVAGLAAGVVLGLLVSLGGSQVYKADADLYLGQPFSPNGNAPVNALATNPRTVSEIIRSESALKDAARASGLHVGRLRGHVSSKSVSGVVGKVGQTPLVEVSVTAPAPRKAEKAANRLTAIVIERVSPYVDTKIATFEAQLASEKTQLEGITARIQTLNEALAKAGGLSALDKLVLVSQLDNAEQRRGQLLELQSQTEQQLSLAENVEKAQVVEPAAAVKTTARSRRNSVLVGGLIGLLLGAIAAIAWDGLARQQT